MEREHITESADKYKKYMASYSQARCELQTQLAKQLKAQMNVKSENRGTEKGQVTNFLHGMACPHGKMYVCAFCNRDQAKKGSNKKGLYN